MNVDIYTFCWNEMASLPWAVGYWKQFATHVTVFDNGSDDGSVEYLSQFGGWVDVRTFDTGGTINDTILLHLKNEVWKESRGHADLVCVCDLDEFVCAPDIARSLALMRRVGGTICEPAWYDLISDEVPEPGRGKLLHNVRPLGVHRPSKALLFSPDDIREINYAPGAHTCEPKGNVRWYQGDIYCLHANHNYSFASKLERYRLMGDRLSDMNREKGHGIHYTFTRQVLRAGWEEDRRGAVNVGAILSE